MIPEIMLAISWLLSLMLMAAVGYILGTYMAHKHTIKKMEGVKDAVSTVIDKVFNHAKKTVPVPANSVAGPNLGRILEQEENENLDW